MASKHVSEILKDFQGRLGLGLNAFARKIGVPNASSIQRYTKPEFAKDQIPDRVMRKVLKIVGQGNPPIQKEEVLALAVPPSLRDAKIQTLNRPPPAKTIVHEERVRNIRDVPLISWVSAGDMLRDDISDEILRTMAVAELPDGDWIALRVSGESMDLISPPESVIMVNRQDKRLVPNGLYVIDDGEGNATYKRYRPGPPARFEAVSQNKTLKPLIPENEPTIVGRVRRSILDM